MPPLQTVYAYRDKGSMGPTRWGPRRVFCSETADLADQPGRLCVAKLKCSSGAAGAAAMISEVVCRELYRVAGINVLDAVVVKVTEEFAVSWNDTPDLGFQIYAGDCFGTYYREDVIAGPPPNFSIVHDSQELLDIWVMDTWVRNIDREVPGNLLMFPSGAAGKVRLIAADQSDCFSGAHAFSTEAWKAALKARKAASGVFVPEAVAKCGGSPAATETIRKAERAFRGIGGSFDQVPAEWWQRAHLVPEHIEEALWERLAILPEALNVQQWELNYGPDQGIAIL